MKKIIAILSFFFLFNVVSTSAQTPVTPTWQVPVFSADEYPVISNAPFSSAGSMVYPVGYGVYFTSAGTVYSAFTMQDTATGSEIYSAGDAVTVSSYSRSDIAQWPDDTYSAFFCLVNNNYVCDFSGVDIHDINQLSGAPDVYAFNMVVSSGVASLAPFVPPTPSEYSYAEIWKPQFGLSYPYQFSIEGVYTSYGDYDALRFEVVDLSDMSTSYILHGLGSLGNSGSNIPYSVNYVFEPNKSYDIKVQMYSIDNSLGGEWSSVVNFYTTGDSTICTDGFWTNPTCYFSQFFFDTWQMLRSYFDVIVFPVFEFLFTWSADVAFFPINIVQQLYTIMETPMNANTGTTNTMSIEIPTPGNHSQKMIITPFSASNPLLSGSWVGYLKNIITLMLYVGLFFYLWWLYNQIVNIWNS